jgi:hypothetical protein
MKQRLFILLLHLLPACVAGQVLFKTIVTQGPVVQGESFQVQFVLEETEKESAFYPPSFQHFRFVSGPSMYGGSTYGANGLVRMKNIVYTLAATKPGTFIIPGATAKVKGELIKSDNVAIQVISKEEAMQKGLLPATETSSNAYVLRAGEDPYVKMRQNLFIKLTVDKQTCFVGQPVTATFKLYSCLESRSDIVKNPGFYGFTVQDMIGLADNKLEAAVINGKKFDVHTVRKVQLYPLQAGSFSIDAMEVLNKVTFAKVPNNKKIEQQITEGVAENNKTINAGTATYENRMSTEPVTITVKGLPDAGKPDTFNGAVGLFNVKTSISKKTLARNEEAELEVTVEGKGNFTQLSAPVIEWPAGIDGFEPTVKDVLDFNNAPLQGKRVFHYRFVGGKSGTYNLPPVNFTFFNTDTNKYKTVKATTAPITISTQATQAMAGNTKTVAEKTGGVFTYWLLAVVLIVAVSAIFLWTRIQKAKQQPLAKEVVIQNQLSVDELLAPVYLSLQQNDGTFYQSLHHAVWQFCSSRFQLQGSQLSKQGLQQAMRRIKISEEGQHNLLQIVEQCDMHLYTSAIAALDKQNIVKDTVHVLKEIDKTIAKKQSSDQQPYSEYL